MSCSVIDNPEGWYSAISSKETERKDEVPWWTTRKAATRPTAALECSVICLSEAAAKGLKAVGDVGTEVSAYWGNYTISAKEGISTISG